MEVSTPDAKAAAAEDMHAVVERLAAARAPDIIGRRHRVHANPGTVQPAVATAAFIADTLNAVPHCSAWRRVNECGEAYQ